MVSNCHGYTIVNIINLIFFLTSVRKVVKRRRIIQNQTKNPKDNFAHFFPLQHLNTTKIITALSSTAFD